MEFIAEYAGFLARTVTVLAAIIVVLVVIVALRGRGRRGAGGHLDAEAQRFLQGPARAGPPHLDKASLKALRKEESKAAKQAKKHPEQKSRVYVLDFDGDIKASATEQLRHEVTAVLSMAGKDDEVVLRLESGGGMVHGYGLAASQLARIRQAGVPLTVCVDKVAASGGYMMACIGDRILSAPFAILGSIGVVAQLPNVHRLLKKHDIDFEVLTAGEYKRTLTVFGENKKGGKVPGGPGGDPRTVQELRGPLPAATEHGRDRHRRGLAGPGRTGQAAGGRTQDQRRVPGRASQERDVYQVQFVERKSLQERVGLAASVVIDRVLVTWGGRLNQQKFWQ